MSDCVLDDPKMSIEGFPEHTRRSARHIGDCPSSAVRLAFRMTEMEASPYLGISPVMPFNDIIYHNSEQGRS